MSPKTFLTILLAFHAVISERISKRSDSISAGTDFLRFTPIQYQTQGAFQGPPDLTALQQTHALGNFHHRFNPTRHNYQFEPNPSPLFFVPQTHITPPQEEKIRGTHQRPVLRPPGPTQESQRPGPILTQESLISPRQNFKILPPLSKTQTSFGSSQDQSIKNAYPSNAPHTIKFSISSQNYSPDQARHVASQAKPPLKSNHQTAPKLSQESLILGNRGAPERLTSNNSPDTTFQLQSNKQFIPPLGRQQNYQNFNIQSPKQSFGLPRIPLSDTAQRNVQYNVPIQSNYNFKTEQQQNEISSKRFEPDKKFNLNNEEQNDIGLRPTEPLLHTPLIQSSIELKQDDLIQKQQEPNFLPRLQSQQSHVESTSQAQFKYASSEPQKRQYLNQQEQLARVVPTHLRNYDDYQTTEFSQQSGITNIKNLQSDDTLLPVPSKPILGVANQRKLAFQKSQDHLHYALNKNLLSKETPNDVWSNTSPVTPETFTTESITYKKPKPIVKEITINLKDHKISNGDVPTQLYIKDDRQKEFQALKEKEEKEVHHKNEKSQEDLINEQIQKLLQSHNLEIIGKDSEAQTNSQEVQLSKVSEQFKKYNYSVQLLNGGGLLSSSKQKPKVKNQVQVSLPPLPELPEHIRKQYDIKLVHKDELLKQFDISGDHDFGNDSSKLFLADDQNLEIVKFSKDGTMNKIAIGTKPGVDKSTTTAKPPKVLFEELTKQVLPPGANFELIKHKGDGKVERVEDLTGEKRVTFVFLEEQPDGSVKIQGVKGNTNQEVEENEDVNSLIKKIKNGSLKLPPPQRSISKTEYFRDNDVPVFLPTTEGSSINDARSLPTASAKSDSSGTIESSSRPDQSATTEFTYSSSPYSINIDSKHPSAIYETTPEVTTFLPTLNYIRSSTRKPTEKIKSNYNFFPSLQDVDGPFASTFGSRKIKPVTSTSPFPWFEDVEGGTQSQNFGSGLETPKNGDSEILSHRSTEYRSQRIRVPQDVIAEESNINAVRPLNEVLKGNGLNEMAKYLDQSGLNTILNETGPYTIFIPTDKAFKTLEAQLGGPDKAEDKFRENPRLLSGLLLHHVVPGSFRVEDLQDEMTGVSLAGTQLRVNTYVTDDNRSKDNNVVTINGAKISGENKDIVVPQGLAHSIDRVLFPLPIGDILQTLKNDRERRFTKFIKSLEHSGLTDMLTGSKTYTVFAPVDKAFSVLTDAELDKLLTRREAAKTIVLRHIIPGTLYTAGMNYFQVKDSMETGQKITIKKELGKIKANSAQIISANVPATNGVIHIVETLL